VSLPSHPFRFGYLAMEPTDGTDWGHRARWARDHGFSTFQVSDHFDRSPAAPLLTLVAAAAGAPRIRVGTLVLDNDFRHPAVLAKELATLDSVSGGRLEVGLGAGWMTADYAVSGITFERAGVRIDKLTETVRILDRVLRADGPLTFVGNHYAVQDLRCIPATVQRPRPPLVIGGGGRRILTLAGSVADVVSLNLSVGEGHVGPAAARSSVAQATDEKLGWVREAAGARFSSLELHAVVYWAAVTDDPERTAAEVIARRGLKLTPPELLASPHCLIGRMEDLVDRVHSLRERWGLSYLTFYDADAPAMAPLVAELAGH